MGQDPARRSVGMGHCQHAGMFMVNGAPFGWLGTGLAAEFRTSLNFQTWMLTVLAGTRDGDRAWLQPGHC